MQPDCLTLSAKTLVPTILLTYTLLICLEMLASKMMRKGLYDFDDTLHNLIMFFVNRMMGGLGGAFLFAILLSVEKLIPWKLNGLLGILTTFLIVDFLFYLQHRVFHTDSIFASFHEIHHTSEHYNFTTTLRASVFLPFINPLFYLPAVLLGADTLTVIISFSLIQVYQFFLHTQLIPKLGFLEGLVNTPDAHRIHHGNQQLQYESNLGGVLMIWDQIFCSYMSDSEKLVYGIKGIKPENNFFVAQISPFVRYLKRHFKNGFTKFRI